jgi:hypothetical protein
LLALAACAALGVRGQVIGLQPTPIALYQWNATAGQFEKITNPSTSEPAQSTPQAFAFYGFNTSLGQWTPCVTLSACLGSGFGGVTQIIPGSNITITPSGGTGEVTINSTGTYLPLSGGTLTGALNGTSASFTGTVAAASAVSSINRSISVIAAPYNAKCDGSTDDTTAISAANTAAQAASSSLQFPSNAICVVHGSFTVISDEAPWYSNGGHTILQWNADAGEGVAGITMYQSDPTYPMHGVFGYAIKGIALLGYPSPGLYFAMDGLHYGDGTHWFNTQVIDSVNIYGFTNAAVMYNNVWRIKTENGRWADNAKTLSMSTPGPGDNFGENMVFENMMFADGGPVIVSDGEIHFNNDSFDNVELSQTNGTSWVHGSHFENPGGGDFGTWLPHYVSVTGGDGPLYIDNTLFTTDCPPSGYVTSTYFSVAPSVTATYGIVLGPNTTLQGVAGPCYRPDLNVTAPVGRQLENLGGPFVGTFDNDPSNYGFVAMGAYKSLLTNGNFRTGDLTGWSTTLSSTGTVSVTSAALHSGAYGAELTATSGQTVEIYQQLKVPTGAVVGGTFQIQGVTSSWGSGCTSSVNSYAVDSSGSTISGTSGGANTVNVAGVWTAGILGSPIRLPQNSAVYDMTVTISSSSGTCSAYFTDAIMTINSIDASSRINTSLDLYGNGFYPNGSSVAGSNGGANNGLQVSTTGYKNCALFGAFGSYASGLCLDAGVSGDRVYAETGSGYAAYWQNETTPYFHPSNGLEFPDSSLLTSSSKLLENCGTLTTTAATTDALACSWVTSASNCTATQNSTTTIVPWTAVVPTTGTVTVTHTATAGGTYAIACSAN